MKRNFTAIVLAAGFFTPLAAFARPVAAPRPHAVVPHDHAPKIHVQKVSAHK